MKPKCQSCNSCGMPMESAEEFALGDPSSPYCKYCTDSNGKLLPFETVLKSNVNYFIETQGLTDQAALKMATDLLKGQPAWKNG